MKIETKWLKIKTLTNTDKVSTSNWRIYYTTENQKIWLNAWFYGVMVFCFLKYRLTHGVKGIGDCRVAFKTEKDIKEYTCKN